MTLNGGLGSLEPQADILVPSPAALSDFLALGLDLRVGEDMRLLLESALRLHSQLGRHCCGWLVSNTDSDVLELVAGSRRSANGRR